VAQLGPICRDERRRSDVLAHPTLNGIDFVEYEHSSHTLVVTLLKKAPPDAYGLTKEQIVIAGGTRIRAIRALSVKVSPSDAHDLEITVDQEGDFSDYELLLGWKRLGDGEFLPTIEKLDEHYSRIPINFKADCPVDFDCRSLPVCPPPTGLEPPIDYLAKDYASFRQLMLDRISQLNPDWLERSPADLGIALVELLAYEGDHLSYFQDAVANETYLDTVRQRVSAKRHARLVDYAMHDGRNAWAALHVRVHDAVIVGQGTKVLSRVLGPLPHQATPPGTVIAEAHVPDAAFADDPVLSRVQVFETAFPLQAHPENNEIYLHTWGDLECCFAPGTTSAYLYALSPTAHDVAVRPQLQPGDYLLLEEVKGPVTGAAADANPAHRQVVQLTEVEDSEDPAYKDELEAGALQVFALGDTALPLVKVSWHPSSTPSFPLCVSARPAGRDVILNISVARANMVLVDHGRTVRETLPQHDPVPADTAFRLALSQAPLTMQRQPDAVQYDQGTGVLKTPRTDLIATVRQVRPAVSLQVEFPSGVTLWQAVPHLLDSPAFADHFVADIDHGGRAMLRFGDGEYGREVAGATSFTAVYRVGNGRSGNVGAEALAHVVEPSGGGGWVQSIEAVRNPLPARDGADPETIEEVRQLAPAAFRAEQFRAVTEADYVAAARKMPQVAGAVAAFRWTGSWHTVFVGIDPKDPNDVITEVGGRTRLAPQLERTVRALLTRYRLAGYDLEIVSGRYVPLDVELNVCVARGYFRGDVVAAVRQALSNRINRDGSRGFFHPDNLTFGQAVYISQLYAAVEAVTGVDSVVVVRFQRFGKLANGELRAGVMELGAWEIARLDNDPNFMENGVLRINADGGK
jgi:hypothetical protein